MALVCLGFGRSRTHPSSKGCLGTVVEIVDGPALKLLGPGGLEERFLTRISSAGKESWYARGGETSGAFSEGKDRDCGRISHDVTWWRIVAGAEI